VSLAEHASAAQVERLVAAYRRTFDPTRRKEADERHTKQSVQWFTDDDGSFVMQVRLDPEDGTFLRGVIEANTEGSIRERPRERRETVGMRRAAALMEMAVLAAGSDAVPLEAADRYLVMVNVDETVLTHDEGTRCELDGGPGLPAETARRVACDASCVRIVRDALSQVVDVGRKTRVIPRWMRRQLHARDGGCVFPGCSERRIVIGHHIHHWTRGGETELRNLIELCAFHHRLVHEGGWTVTFDGVRLVTFFEPDGTPVSNTCRATGSAEPFAPDLEAHVAERGVDVTPRSVVSKWYGEPLDLGLILPAFGLTLETARSSGSNGARDTEHMANDRSIADQLAAHVDDDFCYLTTRGRVTRRPHEIEIWFALDTVQPTTLFLMAGGGDGSDWVRNLRAEPDVTVRVGDATYAARARVIDAESDEDERARTLVHDKFAPRYSGDLTEWRGRALPVAVDVVDVAQS